MVLLLSFMSEIESQILHLAESARQLNNEFLRILEKRYKFPRNLSFDATADEFFGDQFYEVESQKAYSCRWARGNEQPANVYLPINRVKPMQLRIYGRLIGGSKATSLVLEIDHENTEFALSDQGDGAFVLIAELEKCESLSTTIISIHNCGESMTLEDGRDVSFCFEALKVGLLTAGQSR